jgi:hypothetical protein
MTSAGEDGGMGHRNGMVASLGRLRACWLRALLPRHDGPFIIAHGYNE